MAECLDGYRAAREFTAGKLGGTKTAYSNDRFGKQVEVAEDMGIQVAPSEADSRALTADGLYPSSDPQKIEQEIGSFLNRLLERRAVDFQ